MSTPDQPLPLEAQGAHAAALIRWYVLFVTSLVYTLSIADRYVISTVLDRIRIELDLTDAGIGALTGASFAIFYVSCGFPLSWLTDRYSRRNIIAASLIAWSAMTAWCGLARSAGELLLARIGVAVGEAGGTPAANSILSDYFPPSRRPMALTVFSLGAPIGAWLGASVAGRIADAEGWRAVFMWLGIPGVLAGLLVWATMQEPRRGQLDAADGAPAPTLMQTMVFLWRQRSAVHVMVGSALTALWGWGLMWWTPTYLQRTFMLTPGQAGALTGDIHLYGGSIATLATGVLLAFKWTVDPRRVVCFVGVFIALATVVSIGIYWTPSLKLATALFWIFIPSIYFYIGPCFGLLNNLAQPRMRAMFCATTLFLANVCNLVIAPYGVGLLSDLFAAHHAGNAASLRLALLCLAPTGFWSAAHYFWAARDLARDQERASGARV